MKYVDLRISPPDSMLHPMQAFIRHEDAVSYEEIVTWRVRPADELEYVLFYVEADLARYRAAVESLETLVEYRMAPIDETSAHVWACEEIRPELAAWRGAFADRNLVVVPPIRYDDHGAMAMRVVGTGDDVQAMVGAIPDEIGVTVEAIGTYDRRGGTLVGALTDRQLEAVATARRLGYYEVPREAELSAVADALGCAESTASKLLRRAERDVFADVLDRYGGEVGRPADPRGRGGRS